MVPGFVDLLANAPVGHLGIYRDMFVNGTVEYCFRIPEVAQERGAFVVDPVIASGQTALAALDRLHAYGVWPLVLCTIVVSRRAAELLLDKHPDVAIYCAAVDPELDANGALRPGLGDASARLWNTP